MNVQHSFELHLTVETNQFNEIAKHRSLLFFLFLRLAMLNCCRETVQLIQNSSRKWQKSLQAERDARIRMERICEQVASQRAKLEKQIQRASQKTRTTTVSNASNKFSEGRQINDESHSSDDDDEYHDAISDPQTVDVFRIPSVKKKNFHFNCIDHFSFFRLQRRSSNVEKSSSIIDDENDSSGSEDQSEFEDNEKNNLPLVVVKSKEKLRSMQTTSRLFSRLESNRIEISNETRSTRQLSSSFENNRNVNNSTRRSSVMRRKRRDRIPERPNQRLNFLDRTMMFNDQNDCLL